jgi:ketosteroid isomerase-like protein
MRWFLVVLLTFGLVACQPAGAPTDPAAVMDAYTAAINAGNVNGALALVADDAVYDRPGGQFRGKEQVRGFIQSLVDQKAKIELIGTRQVNGTLVTWRSRVTQTNAQGQQTTIENNSSSTVVNGKITTHKAERAN